MRKKIRKNRQNEKESSFAKSKQHAKTQKSDE